MALIYARYQFLIERLLQFIRVKFCHIKSTSNNTTGVFYGLEEPGSNIPDNQKFEYVIVCKFDDNYELQMVLEMDWNTFLMNKRWHSRMHAWNLSLTKQVCQQCKIVYEKQE